MAAEGIDRLINKIAEVSSKLDRPTVVLIAGGTSSGKTSSVSVAVEEAFPGITTRVSADDYYVGIKAMRRYLSEGEPLNFDDPRALDLEGVAADIVSLKNSLAIKKRHYSFLTGEPFEVNPSELIQPTNINIVEGLFVLDDRIAPHGDVRAFVDIGWHGMLIRRLLRDVSRTEQDPADILQYMTDMVSPMHERFVKSTIKNADPGLLLNNEYQPQIEAKRSGLYEHQVKFPTELTREGLRRVGANREGFSFQVDFYYNPIDRDLSDTGEMARIRQEGERWTFTYKGPKENSTYRTRSKFEFELPGDVVKRFAAMYGKQISVLEKQRTFYTLDRYLFTLDNVFKIAKDGSNKNLGRFIEFRMEKDEDLPIKLLEKLKLDPAEAITKAYIEF